MRVLVVGGTGVLGRPVVRALLAAGHDVVATTRSRATAGADGAGGASLATLDLLDPGSVDRALERVRPEVVVHAATALPPGGPRRWAQLEATDALRDAGSRHLAAAAARHGVRRLVGQSFLAGYAPVPDPRTRLDESAPFGPARQSSAGAQRTAAALAALERATLASGVEGVVLRFGFFRGDPAGTEALHDALRRRRFPLPGGAPGVVSFVHVEDAAAAVVAAVERAASGTTYNIADPTPRSYGDHVRAQARAAGAPPPLTVPVALGRLLAPAAVANICAHRPLDVTRALAELGWQPRHQAVS